MTTERLRSLSVLLLAVAPAGCSNGGDGNVNIGNTQVVGAQLSDYVATWDGYAEAYTFSPDGSDRVRVMIDGDGHGTLEVGNAALLPAPTDPNVGYPPGTDSNGLTGVIGPSPGLTEGFLYPIYATQVQANRIQLGANPGDLYAAWCALQTPIPYYETELPADAGKVTSIPGASDAGTVETYYTCLPNEPSMTGANGCTQTAPDGTVTPVDCGKLVLCQFSAVCQCSASGCVSQQIAAGTPVASYPVELDGALDPTGTMLTGTLTLGQRITVHLTKQP